VVVTPALRRNEGNVDKATEDEEEDEEDTKGEEVEDERADVLLDATDDDEDTKGDEVRDDDAKGEEVEDERDEVNAAADGDEDDEDTRLRDRSVMDQGDQLIPRPLLSELMLMELMVMVGPAGLTAVMTPRM
jgi:hypothetical protein